MAKLFILCYNSLESGRNFIKISPFSFFIRLKVKQIQELHCKKNLHLVIRLMRPNHHLLEFLIKIILNQNLPPEIFNINLSSIMIANHHHLEFLSILTKKILNQELPQEIFKNNLRSLTIANHHLLEFLIKIILNQELSLEI